MRKIDSERRSISAAEKLFLEVLEDLNQPNVLYEPITLVLGKICAFFSFGGAFVYELDHTRRFHLKEYHETYENRNLRLQFALEEFLTPVETKALTAMPVIFYSAGEPHCTPDSLEAKFASIFCANTVVAFPVLDTDHTMMGCVGIFDRRSDIAPDEQELSVARTIMNVVANRIKLRIYQQRLMFTRQTLEGIMDNTGIDIYVSDFDTNEVLYVNKSMARHYGGAEAMAGKKCWEVLYPGQADACSFCPRQHLLDEHGNPTKTHIWDYQRPLDGKWFRVLTSAFRWVDGRMAQVVSSVDITESKQNEMKIREMVLHDANTGIPNRRKLQEDFDAFLAEADPAKTAAFLFFDLDDFKRVNDTYGHRAGDLLLEQVAKYLQEASPAAGHAYRYGGDEFIVFMPGSTAGIQKIVDALLARFAKGWDADGYSIVCGISIGVAVYPRDGATCQELLGAADSAMYEAKEFGKGRAFYCRPPKKKGQVATD